MKKMKTMLLVMAVLTLMLIMLWVPACAEEISGEFPVEFFTWDKLGTYAGAAALVALVTQLTKGLPYVSKIPTQVWSYILAVIVLIASQVFTGGLSGSSAALALANGVLVSLAANGGYSLITRVKTASEGN